MQRVDNLGELGPYEVLSAVLQYIVLKILK